METVWDQGDSNLFLKWVTAPDEDFSSDTSRFAVWDLQVIAPERVPHIRRYREQYVRDYATIGIHSRSDSDIVRLTTNGLHSDLLFAPREVRQWITEKYKTKLHELINQPAFRKWDFIQTYALLFPQRIKGELKKTIVEERLEFLQRAQQDRDQNPGAEVSELATLRLILDPTEYEALAPTPEQKQAIIHFLRQLREQTKHHRRSIGAYPFELHQALLALADEVKVTDTGVEVRFAKPRSNTSVPLPDREV